MQSSSAVPLADGQAENPPRAPTWLDKQLLRELDNHWRKAYGCYALAFMLVLGTALMINPPTISTFVDSVGIRMQPVAQTYFPIVLLPVLFFYNFLYTAIRNPAILVFAMCSIYATIYCVIAIRALVSAEIEPLLAWILFYTTNTKSVLFPVMFWSVMNDISTAQTADGISYSRVAYPSLVLAGQIGGLLGSLLAANNHFLGGTPTLLLVQAAALVVAALLVWIGCKMSTAARSQVAAESSLSLQPITQAEAVNASQARERFVERSHGGCRAGLSAVGRKMWEVVEGLYLIATEPYVAGIFWIACAHLVPRVILDYQGTALINQRWPRKVDGHTVPENKDRQTSFFAWCNLANTIGTALLAQLGLRSLIERGGLALTLLACPVAMLTSVLVVCFHHEFWTVQVTLVIVNSVQYALNGPCREMLYVQTSKNIKYKAKSWSDMYGNFLQKTVAAQINLHVNREIDTGPGACTPHCFKPLFTGAYTVVWVAAWSVIAASLGFKHSQLSRDNQKIGENGVSCCRTASRL